MNQGTYICDACKGVFEEIETEEDRIAEMHKLFGDVPPSERSRVCDDCWKAMGFPQIATPH